MKTKRYCRYIHPRLSLPAGILISIICFTGAILVLRKELLVTMGYEPIRESPSVIVTKLYRWFIDGTRTTGKMIVDISTLFLVFTLISGLTVYWLRKQKKSRLTIEHQRGKRRLMFDLHSVLGFYGALISLACALTGLMWSFQRYRDVVSSIFNVEVKRGAPVWRVVYALHFGTCAGTFSKTITFIATSIETLLPITGYWMYLKGKNLV